MTTHTRSAAEAGISVNAHAADVPLVAVMRGEYVNNLHRGVLTVADVSGADMFSAGDRDQPVFLRSAAKPFQVMPAILAGAIERFDLTDRELAVLCSSHHAEPMHTATVTAVLQKAGLNESALQCGIHPPIDQNTAIQRWRHGLDPTPVCNNCSGAHTGMLLACLARGWPLRNYGDPEHPLQRETRRIVSAFSGDTDIQLATDNCAVPTFRLPLFRAAQAFARLASGDGVSGELRLAASRVVSAMTGYPEMIGGSDSFDTSLMQSTAGTVVSKGGADGFAGIGSIRLGLGLAAKISDGNSRALPPVVLPVLQSLRILDSEAALHLSAYNEPEVRTHEGALVGRIVPILSLKDGA